MVDHLPPDNSELGRRVTAARDAYVANILHVHLPPQPPPPTPRELPLNTVGFVGRDAELQQLDHLLAAGSATGTVVITAVSGTAGVGKTALAVRWAHHVAAEFPDGQLYLDLRGYDPDQPIHVSDALAVLLRALGVKSEDVPDELTERASRYRSLLAQRRMLILLDNARSTEQVHLLLPGAGSCLAIVTSRDSLAALVARHGARRIDLDLLSAEESVELLRVLVGARVNADLDAAHRLVDQCVRLPLALRIAAELAVARPDVSLDVLSAELDDEQRRLDLLVAGDDPRTAVRAVFSWSYHHLPAPVARAFRLLALHQGADFDTYIVGALTTSNLEQAAKLLVVLLQAHLIQETRVGRYTMHDLLRIFAAEQEYSAEEQDAAFTRLLDYYLAATAAAMDALSPVDRNNRPKIMPTASFVPPFSDDADAVNWLDTERAGLIAAGRSAARRGKFAEVIALSGLLRRYLISGAHYAEATMLATDALHAARRQGNPGGEAAALHNLAVVQQRQTRYAEAIELYRRALPLRRQAGDRVGEAMTIHTLALAYERLGDLDKATAGYEEALEIYRVVGDLVGEATALDNLGMMYGRLGRIPDAADRYEQALVIARRTGNRATEAGVLDNLGSLCMRSGRYRDAEINHQKALTIVRKVGFRAGEGEVLDNLGRVYRHLQRYSDAQIHHQQALTIALEIDDLRLLSITHNGLGETLRDEGHLELALGEFREALTIATEIGDYDQQARAHDGIAHLLHLSGDANGARRHWQTALALYSKLDAPEADNVEWHLANLEPDSTAT